MLKKKREIFVEKKKKKNQKKCLFWSESVSYGYDSGTMDMFTRSGMCCRDGIGE